MTSPIDIEHRFQDLKHSLSFPASPRQRLFAIGRFLTALDSSSVPKESYLIELADYLPNILAKVDFDGCDPDNVRSLYEQMRVFENFDVDTNAIRLAAVSLFAYAGEIVKAASLLGNESTPDSLLNILSEIQNVPNLTPFARLQKTIEECNDERIAAALKAVADRWSSNITPRVDSITVPVVEHPFVKAPAEEYESSLRRIRMEILGESSSPKDEIHADVSVFGAETNAAEIIAAPITAARNLISEKHSDIAKRFLAGHLLFEGDHALHEGCSANLGIALLAYCAILRSTLQREQYRILPTVAASGAIDEKGNVLPVEAATLPNKVKGAFFSWIEFLIVPKQQLSIAEEAVRSLTETYPHRTLTPISVANMREVFFDRRLAERIRVPFPKHAIRKVWKWRMSIAGVIILALAVALWRLWYGPLDKNPVAYMFEGEMLYLKNKQNQIIDEIRVGKNTVQRQTSIRSSDQFRDPVRGAPEYTAFVDVDHDGLNEVIWIQQTVEHVGHLSTIKCKSIRQNAVMWSVPLIQNLHFLRNTDIVNNQFMADQLYAGDFDNDGYPEVIVNAWLFPMFPSLIIKLDAKNGKKISHYVHIGLCQDMKIVDLDSDGIKEIIASGTNNAWRNACIVVLDPRFVNGHSPLTEDYFVEGSKPGTERAYIRIPKTVIGEAFKKQVKYNWSGSIFIEEPSRTFNVAMLDIFIDAQRREDRLTAGLIGVFGFDLSVKNFATFDDFDLLYQYLIEGNRIPAIRRDLYMQEYRKTILYWDGVDWQNKPVLNKWYLKALKEAGLPPPKGFTLEEPK